MPDFASGTSAALNPPQVGISEVDGLQLCTLQPGWRKEGLQAQGIYLADDQLAGALMRIAGACVNVRVVDPLLMLKSVQEEDPEPLRALGAAFTKGITVISAVPLHGHWVAFAWDIRSLKFEAWDSCRVGLLDIDVASVHRIWGKVLGFHASSFTFRQAPSRPQVPGMCGHFALADLWCYLRGVAPPTHDGALALASTFAAQPSRSVWIATALSGRHSSMEVEPVTLSAWVWPPCYVKKWKALKQLGNNCTPPFQFVLQDELAKSIQSRAAGPDPPTRRKKLPKAQPVSSSASLLRLVEDLCIPEGVFASEGRPLHQVDLQSLDQQSVGVVLTSPAQAEPYLRLGQPVSNGALALVVVGEIDCSAATVQVQKVRFRAKLVATDQPLLVSGTLAQIGNQWVDKFVPVTTPVDIAESCVARLAVYRDACPVP